jgi:hypothetical protein
MFVFKDHEAGFGNLLILLSDCWDTCKAIHRNVYERFELSNCVALKGYTVVDGDEGEHPPAKIIINKWMMDTVHPRLREFVYPTVYMESMINQHMYLLDGVTAAVHIRRGSHSKDSTQFKAGTDKSFFHCSDEGLAKFEQVIQQLPGKVYLASDSKELKTQLKQKYGDKIRTLDTEFAITAHQDATNTQTVKNLQDAYLEWFLLSLCPMVFITGGQEPHDLTGFSTYSYTAAVYGKKPYHLIFNNY